MPRLLTFDVETTGIDVFGDRIVQAFLGLMGDDGHWIQKLEWIIDPGVEVPEGAAAVHGFTTERLRAEGVKDVRGALAHIAQIIKGECFVGNTPLVIFNAPYDTTILNAELRRHDLPELDFAAMAIVDPLVIDKGINKFRKGSRKLVDVAPHYGVPVEANAHDAGADCLMTGRVALRQLVSPQLRDRTFEHLQVKQRAWKAEQSASLQSYFRSAKAGDKQDLNAIVNGEWPIQATPKSTPVFTEGALA